MHIKGGARGFLWMSLPRFVVGRLRFFPSNRLFAFLWKNNNGEYEFRQFTKAELVTFYLHNYTSITPIFIFAVDHDRETIYRGATVEQISEILNSLENQ